MPEIVRVIDSRGLRVRVAGTNVPAHLAAAFEAAAGRRAIPEVARPAPVAEVSRLAIDGGLESLSRQELMRRAAAAGVPAKGRSVDLIAAIRAAEQA